MNPNIHILEFRDYVELVGLVLQFGGLWILASVLFALGIGVILNSFSRPKKECVCGKTKSV